MLDELENQYKAASTALAAAEGREALEAWYRDTLGRKGNIYLLTRNLGALSAEERPAYGRRLNEVKAELEAAYGEKLALAEDEELRAQLAAGALDVTLPGRKPAEGRLHVITQTLRDLYRVFGDMGFQVYRTRDVETDEMNFELLNFPPHHPAREMQDSFYTTVEGVILRTHTSAGQIRAMREYYPEPIRVVLPGMCYRNEQVTARSEMQFTQLELLAVGENITFADLKGTLTEFARRMFGAERQTRFRASYFPFTEPSAEMDISCFLCGGAGCNICKYTGWLEILGCGMVHPTVLRNGGYDPLKYFGFAAGLGPERIAMLKYGIDDIRQFWANDLRFLEQF
ncbi:MAG: phenylalanine--tRNA ligase subunit alpha [Anaerolineae bacterium]|uniref:phenylalanine--tRNA ligase subunit alpha n=1 Tax=Promineifilum sp. TaxID=2664178 RepID=UPI001DB3A625|nr:phenylalanine--tRNA ligase subunit alpha [Anaerolineales bacterium]MCB8933928.1 phenylalanine--tRNA ligase subunit alpha [Promineifilum sp.]MCO5179329.1 phenylalanine--tRNA ligase subunit alpha [Promineifilum sp.]MCW5848442.1 phenylalanine--tRNA ligase subunit alpha [Anaerolineae bacterium]